MSGFTADGRRASGGGLGSLAAVLVGLFLVLAGCAPSVVSTPAPVFAVAPPTAGIVQAWVGTPDDVRTTQAMTLYRVWGGTARQLGAWMSATPPLTSASVRADMALPPQNTAQFWCEVTVPAGTRMRVGVAAPAFDQPGGGRQVELLELIPAAAFGEPHSLAP